MATFAEWLKADRLNRHMSQTEYGLFLEGTSHATVGKYENPDNEPEKDFLKIVSRCTKTSIEFLSSIAYKDVVHGMDPELLAIAEIIKRVPENDRKLLIAAAERLAIYEVKQSPKNSHSIRRKLT